jgi:hypothetical protein
MGKFVFIKEMESKRINWRGFVIKKCLHSIWRREDGVLCIGNFIEDDKSGSRHVRIWEPTKEGTWKDSYYQINDDGSAGVSAVVNLRFAYFDKMAREAQQELLEKENKPCANGLEFCDGKCSECIYTYE